MPEYHLNVEPPPVQARPTTVTVTCGETEMDIRQVLGNGRAHTGYAKVGEWMPSPEWRQPVQNKDTGFTYPPSLPYDHMLALVKERVENLETQRLLREQIYEIEADKN